MENSFYHALKRIYGDHLEVEKSEVENSESKQHYTYTLYSRELPRAMLALLFISVVCIYFCTLLSFWSDLLIAESQQCNEEMDCYALNNTIPVQQQPVDNCTKFSEAGYDIECYTFTFNYIDAIGNAGSVLVIGFLLMVTQSAVYAGMLALRVESVSLLLL